MIIKIKAELWFLGPIFRLQAVLKTSGEKWRDFSKESDSSSTRRMEITKVSLGNTADQRVLHGSIPSLKNLKTWIRCSMIPVRFSRVPSISFLPKLSYSMVHTISLSGVTSNT